MFTKEFAGLLFIGDPHVCSKKVGRRKDDYLSSVLEKLTQCAKLCHEQNLMPVILGDLFHNSGDNSIRMLCRLTRVLKLFPMPPLVLDGNHDMAQTVLSDSDSLELLALSGTVVSLGQVGEVGRVRLQGTEVRLWACPAWAALPTALPPFEGPTVLLTHHDMAFGSSYPFSQELTAIENCGMVVNGHMHDTKPSVLVTETWWHNPGNIEPLTIDLEAHVPNAWRWDPETPAGTLTALSLPHGTDLFDQTGRIVDAANAQDSVQALVDSDLAASPGISQFSRLIKEQAETEAQKTDDASVLALDLVDVLDASAVSGASRQLMQALMLRLEASLATSAP